MQNACRTLILLLAVACLASANTVVAVGDSNDPVTALSGSMLGPLFTSTHTYVVGSATVNGRQGVYTSGGEYAFLFGLTDPVGSGGSFDSFSVSVDSSYIITAFFDSSALAGFTTATTTPTGVSRTGADLTFSFAPVTAGNSVLVGFTANSIGFSNNSGIETVLSGLNNDSAFAPQPTGGTVPEPTTFALILGAVGLAGLIRRRNHKQPA